MAACASLMPPILTRQSTNPATGVTLAACEPLWCWLMLSAESLHMQM